MKILLVCQAGMSTSLLVEKMRENASSDIVIDATNVGEFHSKINDYDVILIGPQLRYRKAEYEKLSNEMGKPLAFIDPMMYGRLMGKEVLNEAIELVGKK